MKPEEAMPNLIDGLSGDESDCADSNSPNPHSSANLNGAASVSFEVSDINKESKPLENELAEKIVENTEQDLFPEEKMNMHEYDTDEETDKLLGNDTEHHTEKELGGKKRNGLRKATHHKMLDPENNLVFIEGILFRCSYLGSTQLSVLNESLTKSARTLQAQEAVGRIKAPEGESQPSVDVELFVSTDKIMVLNSSAQDVIMDYSLRSISYIADIGDLFILMAKRCMNDSTYSLNRMQKMLCHIFQSDEAQAISKAVGQAFHVAYIEFLKVNGIEDSSFLKQMNYEEVLSQQEICTEELRMFASKECQKEAIVPKHQGEPLGVVLVESGWGSMIPTVVIANMMPGGPAARCGNLNIGDQIISVNGISVVGLSLSTCQSQIKNLRHLTTVRLVVIPCHPVVDVLIRRPDAKYQLGFSVQNGVICSLLRGGIAERGGIRVGHRIIEINNTSVVATSHEKIVNMLASAVGELKMRTMPAQMFRLLTGQETPVYI